MFKFRFMRRSLPAGRGRAHGGRPAFRWRTTDRAAAVCSGPSDTLDLKEGSVANAGDVQFRLAGRTDADAIAALHADSWRRHYRGAYSDAFLDGDVLADRVEVWRRRLGDSERSGHTVVAEGGGSLIGFAHTVLDDHPMWGALLDNLHVTHRRQREGTGSRLLALTARAVIERETGLYLWVLEQNVEAQAFYEAHGGERVESALVAPPGGVADRLSDSPVKLRYAWHDPAVLLRSARGTRRGRAEPPAPT
jgi:GNAT superfamily N-acetyltransferase